MSDLNLAALAERLSGALALEGPPIALAFTDRAPEGAATFTGNVPSACTLWRRAEQGVIYAAADRHYNCAVGAMTMGFPLPDGVQQDLAGAVELMVQHQYLSPEEPAHLPRVQKQSGGILYGPLGEFPQNPDAVLLWLTPRQAMLVEEAGGGTTWTGDAPARVLGRPACSAIPLAMNDERLSLSLGCAGMRTYTTVADDRLLAVIPGAGVEELTASIERTVAANTAIAAFHAERKATFAD